MLKGSLWRDSISPYKEYAVYGLNVVGEAIAPIHKVALDDTSDNKQILTREQNDEIPQPGLGAITAVVGH